MKIHCSLRPYKLVHAQLLACSGLTAALFCLPAAAAPGPPVRPAEAKPAGLETRQVTTWIRATRNNEGRAFAIIDKRAAQLQVFDGAGTLRGSSPVLLGLAVGDDSVPGIGERKMADIKPAERTTPAGRFVTEPGFNLQREDIVWIDYESAISMHRVRTGNKADRRLDRLATPSPADNRISYGCVNVPAAFYDALIKPFFGATKAVVYVLPETRSASAVFGMGASLSSAGPIPTRKP